MTTCDSLIYEKIIYHETAYAWLSRIHYQKHNIIHNMKYYIYKTQRFEIQSKKEVGYRYA